MPEPVSKIDEACARAACVAVGIVPDADTAFSGTPQWRMMLPLVRQVRAIVGVLGGPDMSAKAAAPEIVGAKSFGYARALREVTNG